MKTKICWLSMVVMFVLVLSSISPAAAQNTTAQPGVRAPEVALGQPGLSFRYVSTFGVTASPYLADGAHLNRPFGMFMDGANNLFVAEADGSRVLKYDSSGAFLLALGHAGITFDHDDFLNYPKDVTVNPGNAHIWVAARSTIKEFDAAGNVVQMIPANNPWETGSDNGHFSDPYGIAFSHSGLLFVADSGNNRVQVYNVSTTPPTFVNTIGETGVAGSGDSHFKYPNHLAFDSSDALYVLDVGNYRVQKCSSIDQWAHWSCNTFFGGTQGSDPSKGEMDYSMGLHVDKFDNVFIADGVNSVILKCTPGGICSHFIGVLGVRAIGNDRFGWASDVTTDSGGNVYVSDPDIMRIQEYDSTGAFVKTFAGTMLVPYATDTTRMNAPWGVTVDASGNLYITETRGYRLLKYNAQGVQQWTIGSPGMFIFDWGDKTVNNLFSNPHASLQGNPALDANGNLFVSDYANSRVQIYRASDGAYVGTMGVPGEYGDDNDHFACPTGIAISPVNGDIFIADFCLHRIQVFNSNRAYKTTLGETNISGADNERFNSPEGVAVDSSGAVFVADFGNTRVQKCTTTDTIDYTCTTFAGLVGQGDNDFGHFHPLSVALDKSGRVYVVDEWNNRVQVYDTNGAYLTTLAGSTGQASGQLFAPKGVAVDSAGNVYITDIGNHRIQKFAAGVPGWRQVNINGFGQAADSTTALEVFNNQLYAAASTWSGSGGRIYRSSTGKDWTPASEPGFGDGGAVTGILDLAVFKGKLYATTAWGNANNGARIYRTDDGATWNPVVSDGFGNANSIGISVLVEYKDWLYAAVQTHNDGLEIWRSATGNAGDWSQVVSGGHHDANNGYIFSFVVFNGALYASVGNDSSGDEVWRTSNGTVWNKVFTDGFGDPNNNFDPELQVFNNQLYASLGNKTLGGQLWRSSNGTDWEKVVVNGFGHPNNTVPSTPLFVYSGSLYAIARNDQTGFEIWQSPDGTTWRTTGIDGFGDSNNYLWGENIITTFNGLPYIATWNGANGGEIWQMLPQQIYLPVVAKP